MRKKQHILNAAERLFYSNGFHATSTDYICREAKVSTRTLYQHFPSRERLTAAVMTARRQRFADLLSQPDDPAAISQLFSVLEQWMRAEGTLGCFFAKAYGEYAEQDAELAAQALDYRYWQRGYIRACLAHSHRNSPSALADAIWILFEGAIMAGLIDGPQAAVTARLAAEQLMANAP
ncbi:TetR/AcrR family transcriptional regulator [Pantoea sp. Cy-640]|jgi:AcrR family transcriptional regulator|uniref:TetR/AcrR family transcriptional regulator n=1 Tax=Pantoea sp. Cy-640 TaxID=2608353 RepID=UPI00141953D0|nr:TetR/AcrR family transcriptional regulator [Pantoea sp. Cy-640]NIG15824.1 TetR/AcrR family transcriptional regulator [Pantoea sp. Cy-640]